MNDLRIPLFLIGNIGTDAKMITRFGSYLNPLPFSRHIRHYQFRVDNICSEIPIVQTAQVLLCPSVVISSTTDEVFPPTSYRIDVTCYAFSGSTFWGSLVHLLISVPHAALSIQYIVLARIETT